MRQSACKGIKRALGALLSVLWWCAVAILALILVNVLGAKASGRVPAVFGYSVLNIVSGSMEDEIPKGSYILVKSVDPKSVEVGDVISFYSTDPKIYGMPNTHRVTEIVGEGAELEFVTKGDANPTEDRVRVSADRLIGVQVGTLVGLAAFSNMLGSGGMLFVLVCLFLGIGALVLFSIIIGKNKSGDGGLADDEKNR